MTAPARITGTVVITLPSGKVHKFTEFNGTRVDTQLYHDLFYTYWVANGHLSIGTTIYVIEYMDFIPDPATSATD